MQAIEALIRLTTFGPKQIIDLALEAAADKQPPATRIDAVELIYTAAPLYKHKQPEVMVALKKLLEDSKIEVRKVAVSCLAHLIFVAAEAEDGSTKEKASHSPLEPCST